MSSKSKLIDLSMFNFFVTLLSVIIQHVTGLIDQTYEVDHRDKKTKFPTAILFTIAFPIIINATFAHFLTICATLLLSFSVNDNKKRYAISLLQAADKKQQKF